MLYRYIIAAYRVMSEKQQDINFRLSVSTTNMLASEIDNSRKVNFSQLNKFPLNFNPVWNYFISKYYSFRLNKFFGEKRKVFGWNSVKHANVTVLPLYFCVRYLKVPLLPPLIPAVFSTHSLRFFQWSFYYSEIYITQGTAYFRSRLVAILFSTKPSLCLFFISCVIGNSVFYFRSRELGRSQYWRYAHTYVPLRGNNGWFPEGVKYEKRKHWFVNIYVTTLDPSDYCTSLKWIS